MLSFTSEFFLFLKIGRMEFMRKMVSLEYNKEKMVISVKNQGFLLCIILTILFTIANNDQ